MEMPDGSRNSYRTYQPRLFRKDERIRYHDRIHETLAKAMKAHPELRITNTNLLIYHYGFIKTKGEERRRKNRRYAERLVAHLEEHQDDGTATFALANHLIQNGNADDGDMLLERAINLDPLLFQARFELACRMVQRGVEVLLAAPTESVPKEGDIQQAASTLVRVNQKFCRDLKMPLSETETV